MNTPNSMITQGAVDIPGNLPVSAPNGPLIGPCSGMWDGNEKGWTVVQAPKKRKGKGKEREKTKEKEKTRVKKSRA